MTDERRWSFRFRLRTLLILVTLCCLWLGWEVFVVRHRKSVLSDMQRRLYVEPVRAAQYEASYPNGNAPNPIARVSALRRLLGDEPVQEIRVSPTIVKESDHATLRRWFPEAKVVLERPMEPCHPGCFPAGTQVLTADGPRAIETIRVGTRLVAFDRDGRQILAPVTAVFTTTNRLVEIVTPQGSLHTTPTQPLAQSFAEQQAAGKLAAGDEILVWDGARPIATHIERARQTEHVARVFNLVLSNSELFVAGGFVARSKPPLETPSQDAKRRDMTWPSRVTELRTLVEKSTVVRKPLARLRADTNAAPRVCCTRTARRSRTWFGGWG